VKKPTVFPVGMRVGLIVQLSASCGFFSMFRINNSSLYSEAVMPVYILDTEFVQIFDRSPVVPK